MTKSSILSEITEDTSSEINEEGMEIKEIFSKFKNQVEDLKTKSFKIEKSLEEAINELKAVQDEELKLRDNISILVKKEADLNQKRIELEKQLTLVKDKHSKLLKINSELADLWR